MGQEILIVEYEPRYTERVRQALSGHVLQPVFAKDGEEALRALENTHPKLIVVSSMLPKMTSSDLIRNIRGRSGEETPPILLTITGYNGKSPKTDAAKLGASDLLPKPYSSTEFLGKVRQMLGDEAPEMPAAWATAEIHDELKQFEASPRAAPVSAAPAAGAEKEAASKSRVDPLGDIDQMLAQTLSGVRLPGVRKSEPAPAKESSPLPDLEKLLEDTLSGLEKKLREKEAAARARQPQPAAPAEPAKPRMEAKWMSPVVPAVEPAAAAPPAKGEEFDETNGTRFGQYLLTERVAVGGMAEVWKARMRGVEGFQKIVAIKKILPHLSDNAEFVDMFIDEGKLAAQLNHSNIIHIYDLGKIASSYYIAMEFIDGHDLKSILRRAVEKSHPIPIELALFIASKVASALDYAHRKRDFDDKELELVHRDISPQNVLISHEGDIKLCDFGIAKAASKASHTLSGALKGKLQYMSPEQAWGRKVDRRSDIFALGIFLFELLAGRKLFIGDNELSILEQVRQAKVAPPSAVNDEVTPEIDAIVLKALQREPENRYQTAGEMAKDLDAIVYNFWPTPTSADVAIYMHHLYSEEPVAQVVEAAAEPAPVQMPPFEVPAAVPIPAPSPAPLPEPPKERASAVSDAPFASRSPFPSQTMTEERKGLPVAAMIVGGLVLAGAAAGGYFVLKGGPQTSTPPGVRVVAAAAAMTPQPGAPPPSGGTATSGTAIEGLAPAAAAVPVDDARIDEEVQRRLEAERQRLEAERTRRLAGQGQPAQGQPAQTQTASPPATTTQSAVATAEPVPLPVQVDPTPVPTPIPTPVVVQSTPLPTPPPVQVPARAALKPGDLAEPGTDGLVPPQLVKPYKPPYPPMAKAQKVEGVVVVQVLVSETGKVLSVKILRGVAQKVGINEAALEAARRSTFRPGNVGGVPVKSYKNVTVPFRL